MTNLSIIATYVFTVFVLARLFKRSSLLTESTVSRSSPLDALRGLLATAVVSMHFVVTYQWKTEGVWIRPKSELLNNLGVVPVSVFFMITGFLFIGKVYNKEPDWPSIARSRILRVMPLYIFVLAVLFVISLFKTGFSIHNESHLLLEVIRWLAFSGNTFNGFPESAWMTAGAHWTLRYEALFYLSLPLIATILNRRNYGFYLLVSALLLSFLAVLGYQQHLLSMKFIVLFLIGFLPVIIKTKYFSYIPLFQTKTASLIALVCICFAMTMKEYSLAQMLVLGVPFTAIALGNDMFTILKNSGLKALGEISYSIYLTHGLILYCLFSIFNIFPFDSQPASHYLLLLPLIIGIVSLSSVMTFIYIEKPMISMGKRLRSAPAVTAS